MGLLDQAKKKQEERTAELRSQTTSSELKETIEKLETELAGKEMEEQKLRSVIAELQSTNQNLLLQIAEQEQKLLLQIAELQSEIAEQQNRIAQQQEQIEMLNASDLQLKQSEELKQSAEMLTNEAEKKLKAAKMTAIENEDKGKILDLREKAFDKQVADEKERLESRTQENYRTYKNTSDKISAKILLACVLYQIILTIIWGRDHMAVIKTIPQWFTDRTSNIAWIWGKGKELLSSLEIALAESMSETGIKLIVIGCATIAGLSLMSVVVFCCVILCRKAKRLIHNCKKDGTTGFKVAISASVIFACFPLSVLIVETWAVFPSVLSVWIVLGTIMITVVLLLLKGK